ncbi:hypothetical protein DL771_012160 [Monosporascus sp. 5C6A]|nr:hypothetical protein DL771_012160 [Monosporascus sp. 5C6A]
MLAVREALFQAAFMFIPERRTSRIGEIESLLSRTTLLVEWLLLSGQNPDISIVRGPRGTDRVTPLQIASEACMVKLQVLLVESGADPFRTLPSIADGTIHFVYSPCEDFRKWDMAPLPLAIYSLRNTDDTSAISCLLEATSGSWSAERVSEGFLPLSNVLTLAAGHEDDDVALTCVSLILNHFKRIFNFSDIDSSTRLILEMLEKAFTPTQTNSPLPRGFPPPFSTIDVLVSAASRGNSKLLKYLWHENMDVNTANALDITPLHAAADGGHLDMCRLLFQLGSRVDFPEYRSPSPVHLASYRNHLEVVDLLVRRGADVNRGIEIVEKSVKFICRRYFRDNSYLDRKVSGSYLPFQTPIGAAVYEGKGRGFLRRWHDLAEGSHFMQPPFKRRKTTSTAALFSYLVGLGATPPALTLSYAISRADPELLSAALKANADPNGRDSDNDLPLLSILKCSADDMDDSCRAQMGLMLLEAGTEVSDGDAVRAMHFGDWKLVEEILDHDLHNVSQSLRIDGTNGEETLLEAAISMGQSGFVRKAFELNPSSYSPGALCAASFQAVQDGDMSTINKLLSNRLPNLCSLLSREMETTAIGIAACHENSTILDCLVNQLPFFNTARLPAIHEWDFKNDHGTFVSLANLMEESLSKRDRRFWHELHKGSVINFALNSRRENLRRLLDRGYKPDGLMLMILAHLGDPILVIEVTESRLVAVHEDFGKSKALRHAIYKSDIETLKALLEVKCVGLDNAKELNHCLLIEAIERGDPALIDFLSERQFDVDAVDTANNITALQAAALYGRLSTAQRLIDMGANVDSPAFGKSSRTALEAAAEHGRVDMIELLLKHGAEITEGGSRQYVRSICLAEQRGQKTAADMLKDLRPWTAEDEEIKNKDNLLIDQPGIYDSSLESDSEMSSIHENADEIPGDDSAGTARIVQEVDLEQPNQDALPNNEIIPQLSFLEENMYSDPYFDMLANVRGLTEEDFLNWN